MQFIYNPYNTFIGLLHYDKGVIYFRRQIMADKKFYWLKLNQDFFKRSDIIIVEKMPNGKDYILFYLKLLLEGVSNNGNLRFTDTIPYDENMLSAITNTDIDVVRSAMKIFTSMGMIEVLDDQTIFMTEIEKMTGSASDNSNADRQRRFRERKKQQALPSNNESVTKCNASVTPNVTESVTENNQSKSIELEKEKDTEIEIDTEIKESKPKKSQAFIPPTLEEIQDYINENNLNIDAAYFYDHYEGNGWYVGSRKMKDWKATLRNWNRRDMNRPAPYAPQNTTANPFDF